MVTYILCKYNRKGALVFIGPYTQALRINPYIVHTMNFVLHYVLRVMRTPGKLLVTKIISRATLYESVREYVNYFIRRFTTKMERSRI